MARGASSRAAEKDQPVRDMAPPGFAELQAALQWGVAQFSGTLSTLQSDVTSVKTTQDKMKMAAIFQ